MPNIKSAMKRVTVNAKKKQQNKMLKSRLNTEVKKFKTAINENRIEDAEKLFVQVVSYLDKMAKDNTIHKNNASNKQATFAKMLHNAKQNKEEK